MSVISVTLIEVERPTLNVASKVPEAWPWTREKEEESAEKGEEGVRVSRVL